MAPGAGARPPRRSSRLICSRSASCCSSCRPDGCRSPAARRPRSSITSCTRCRRRRRATTRRSPPASTPSSPMRSRKRRRSATSRRARCDDDLRDLGRQLDGAPRGTTSRIAASLTPGASGVENSVAVMTFANITREPADDWIGTGIAETVSSDLKNIHGLTIIGRARVFDALRNLSSNARLDESLAIDIGRRLGATWVVVGGFQRLGELVRITANFVDVHSGQVRRNGQGRRPDRRHLRPAGQDRLRADAGAERRAARHRGRRHRAAGNQVGRRLRELRARHDEPAAGDARLDRAGDCRVRGGDALRLRVRHGLGRARRRICAEGQLPVSLQDLVVKGLEMEQRALAIDPDLSDAHAWLWYCAAVAEPGRRGDELRFTRRSASIPATVRRIRRWPARSGSARGTSPPRFRCSSARSCSIPKPATRTCSSGCCCRGKGATREAERVLRRAVDLQDQFISGNAGLQMVGANARLGYVYYLQGRNAEAIREYERGMAFLHTSDHALKERSIMELDIKLGAAYLRDGKMDEARQHFDRALKTFESRVAKGADDPVHALLHRRSARAPRRRRPGLRFARAGLREAAGADRRADRARSRPRRLAGRPALRAHRRLPRRQDLIAGHARRRHRGRRTSRAERRAGPGPVPPLGAGLRYRPAAELRLARDARLSHSRRHAAVRVPRRRAPRARPVRHASSCATSKSPARSASRAGGSR